MIGISIGDIPKMKKKKHEKAQEIYIRENDDEAVEKFGTQFLDKPI